jgi:hypothetical protein
MFLLGISSGATQMDKLDPFVSARTNSPTQRVLAVVVMM